MFSSRPPPDCLVALVCYPGSEPGGLGVAAGVLLTLSLEWLLEGASHHSQKWEGDYLSKGDNWGISKEMRDGAGSSRFHSHFRSSQRTFGFRTSVSPVRSFPVCFCSPV
jgi:hypothetical protein